MNHWDGGSIVLYQHEIFLEPSVFPRVSYMFHGLDRRTSRCCTSWPCCTAIVSSGLRRAPAFGACSRPGDLGNRRTGFLGHFGAGKWKMTICHSFWELAEVLSKNCRQSQARWVVLSFCAKCSLFWVLLGSRMAEVQVEIL